MDNTTKIDFINKALEYKSNIVGQGFATQLKDDNHLCISMVGEIVEGEGFDGDNLFIVWEFSLPPHWHLDNQELLEFEEHTYEQVELDEWNRIKSVTQFTQSVMHKGDDGQMVSLAHFCFPFDLQFQVPEHVAFHRFPVLIMQINSIDSWDRNTVEGYGIMEIPHTPGFHELTIRTFKPNDDLYTKVFQFFLGGSIKVKEFHYLSNTLFRNNLDVDSVLNRFTQYTESSGSIKIRVNVSVQKETYKEQMLARQKEIEHLQMFQRVRDQKRRNQNQQVEQANIPTTLIKTQTGLVNRFNNTNLNPL